MEFVTHADYGIQISGMLHERWSHRLGDVTITIKHQEDRSPLTVLHCPQMDQAKLRGVLNTIWDLNLALVSVHRLSPYLPDSEGTELGG